MIWDFFNFFCVLRLFKSDGFHELELQAAVSQPSGCWEPNSGHLQEQYVLFTESSLLAICALRVVWYFHIRVLSVDLLLVAVKEENFFTIL